MATAAKKPVKKTAANKKTVKKSTSRPVVARATASPARSDFMQTKFTEQSLYWVVFGMSVIALALWTLSLQMQLNSVYDSISSSDSTVLSSKKAQ